MKRWPFVSICLATAMLGGCAPSSLPGLSAGTPTRSLPALGLKHTDLLYVSDVGTNEVFVYSYPQGTLVQTLQGFLSPVRVCSDTSGNIFVTNTNAKEVVKYRHGGDTPVATYRDRRFLPVDCAVDPATGTLAVTNYGPNGSNTGSVTIYKNGAVRPQILRSRDAQAYLFCTYDGTGNLFVSALDSSYNFLLLELPKGSKTFRRIAVNQRFTGWGGLQWDGTHLAVSDATAKIYDFAIKGKTAKKVRTTRLLGGINVVQFSLDGSTVIGPDGPNGANHDIGIWNYPRGGLATARIGDGLLKNPSGAALSRTR